MTENNSESNTQNGIMLQRVAWLISFIVTGLLITLLCIKLYSFNEAYDPDSEQLATTSHVTQYLAGHLKKHQIAGLALPIYIPTGLFIESVKFIDANTVHITGYLWQKYPLATTKNVTRGFVFPEADKLKQYKAYERKENNADLIGWYFEGDFIQGFDYSKYPLDHKTIWLRIWHKDFDKNIILTPDLASYISTKPRDKFGLDQSITLGGYTALETFFEYKLSNYDTNFGIKNYIGQKNFPELYFNIVLKRNVLSIFVTYLFPLVVVLLLAFASMFTISTNKDDRKQLGFSFFDIIRICAILLFIVLLSHIRLREVLAGEHLVYLEYIYIILYFALLYVAFDAFLFVKVAAKNGVLKCITCYDNLFPKVLFLPLVFALILVATYGILG